MRRYITSIVLITFYSLALSTGLAERLSTKASTKYGFAFKPDKADSSYKSYIKKYPYCVKVSSSKFSAASKFSSGNAKFPKASTIVTAANKTCKSISKKITTGGITLSPAGNADVSRGIKISAIPSYCGIRVTSTGASRVVCLGMESETSATFDLPNGTTLIETSEAGQSLSQNVSPHSTCRYQFVATSGAVSCLSVLQSISYIDQSPLSSGIYLPTFQATSSKDIIFIGGTTESLTGTTIFKLSKTGALSQIASIEDTAETISKFIVEDSGRVVFTGDRVDSGSGDRSPFIRTISTTGSVSTVTNDSRTIAGSKISYLIKDYDGRALIGLSNYGTTLSDVSNARIVKLSSDGTSLENLISNASASPSRESIDSFCSGATGALTSFCSYSGTLITSAYASSTSLYTVSRTHNVTAPYSLPEYTAFTRISPSLQQISLTNITKPLYVSGYGQYLLISGQNDSGTHMLVKYNSDTSEETVLATDILLPFPLHYAQSISSMVGVGNRTTDMAIMTLQIPIASGTLSSLVTAAFPLTSGAFSYSFAY